METLRSYRIARAQKQWESISPELSNRLYGTQLGLEFLHTPDGSYLTGFEIRRSMDDRGLSFEGVLSYFRTLAGKGMILSEALKGFLYAEEQINSRLLEELRKLSSAQQVQSQTG